MMSEMTCRSNLVVVVAVMVVFLVGGLRVVGPAPLDVLPDFARPLAETPDTDDPALARKQAEFLALAQALGRADAGEREGIGQKLRECQAAVDRYREQKHESHTP